MKKVKEPKPDSLLLKYSMLKELMDHVPDVIYFKDRQGHLIMVNRAHARGLGLKPEEVVGKTDFDIFGKERAEAMAKDDELVIKTGKPIIDKIERATRPDGVDNYVSTTKIPRYNHKGEIIGLIGITRDITHRMQLKMILEEKELVERKLQILEYTNKVKSDFISVVSHELRTPLAIIKDAAMLMLDNIAGPVNNNQRKLLTRIRNRIEHLRNMINNLLDISRIEKGRLKINYSLVNLNSIIRESADYFRRLAQSKAVTLKYRLPKKNIELFVDAEKINQVIFNLLSNAIKFTEEGGKITVGVMVFDTRVRIEVIDTGTGISSDNLQNIFQRFVQAPQANSTEKKGLGLGLYIAKDLIERHGGEIWAESELGIGSKFYFTLPWFYITDVFSKNMRDNVNKLLDKDVSLFLVDLDIINYGQFIRKINIGNRSLAANLKSVITAAGNDFYHRIKHQQLPFFVDSRGGEFFILFSEVEKKDVSALCGLLKRRINAYFLKQCKKEAVFIDHDNHPLSDNKYTDSADPSRPKFFIKKIFIGQEIRCSHRINYTTRIDIIAAGGKKNTFQTLNISEGGACVLSKKPFKTDSPVNVALNLGRGRGLIQIKAKVAWIKEEYSPDKRNTYTLGLEFIKLKDKDKKMLASLIKFITQDKKDKSLA